MIKKQVVKRIAIVLISTVTVIALLIGAWVAWYHLSGTSARDVIKARMSIACIRENVREGQDWDCDGQALYEAYPEAAKWCDDIHGTSQPIDYSVYAYCLENQGVSFE